MTPSEAAAILRKHNEWRRNICNPNPGSGMQPPKLIGEAIDVVVEYIESREYKKP